MRAHQFHSAANCLSRIFNTPQKDIHINMTTKTPTSVLTEFCAQKKVTAPQFELVPEETEPNKPLFTIVVAGFNLIAKGSGRSKSEAKHAASESLLSKYKIQIPLHNIYW